MPDALTETLTELLRTGLGQPDLVVVSAEPARPGSGELDQAWRAEKYRGGAQSGLEGVFPIDLAVRDRPGDALRTVATMLKARHRDGLGATLLPRWLEEAGVTLSRPLMEYGTVAEFLCAGEREITVYRLGADHDAYRRFLPARLGDRVDAGGDQYLLLIERVDDAVLMDSADDIAGWGLEAVGTVIDALARLHAVGATSPDVLSAGPWPAAATASTAVIADAELFLALATCGRRNLPHIVTKEIAEQWERLIASLGEWYPPKDALPRTLVHDDCNPRNVCFRADGAPLLYDWEVATVDVPQRDLVELLTFTLTPDTDLDAVRVLAERHRRGLEATSGLAFDAESWWEGVRIQVRYEAVNRVAWQWLFATQIELPYVSRITATVSQLVRRLG